MSLRFVADGAWPASDAGPVTVDDGLRRGAAAGLPRLPGVVAPGVVDGHVHLGLVDPSALAGSGVVGVLDCGWDPAAAAVWRAHPPSGVRVRALGPFHTPPGGYPSGRWWAPDAAVRTVADADGAVAAVRDVAARGFDGLKVVVHAASPFAPGVLEALVGAAHAAGLPAHAHAEGRGAAARAVETGIDVLVHVPWSEPLDAATIERAGARMTWVSTFDIHDPRGLAVAQGNARRFVAAGGRLRYGTDTGNGPEPAGVRRRELALLAEVLPDRDALVRAIAGAGEGWPVADLVWAPGPWPADAAGVVDWYARARRPVPADLEPA